MTEAKNIQIPTEKPCYPLCCSARGIPQFVPQNGNEERMKAIMEILTPGIKDYEMEQLYKDDYEY
ncbi:MAG: hypothetical protein IKN75_02490 [Prevotella sp.]|nr:hypothetical protein [Prevotella sp.]